MLCCQLLTSRPDSAAQVLSIVRSNIGTLQQVSLSMPSAHPAAILGSVDSVVASLVKFIAAVAADPSFEARYYCALAPLAPMARDVCRLLCVQCVVGSRMLRDPRPGSRLPSHPPVSHRSTVSRESHTKG